MDKYPNEIDVIDKIAKSIKHYEGLESSQA